MKQYPAADPERLAGIRVVRGDVHLAAAGRRLHRTDAGHPALNETAERIRQG